MQDAAWVVVLLWLLASWVISRITVTPREVVLPVLGHAALIGALLIFLILNVTWVLGGFGGLDVTRSLVILAIVVVILIISFLVAYGWGARCGCPRRICRVRTGDAVLYDFVQCFCRWGEWQVITGSLAGG